MTGLLPIDLSWCRELLGRIAELEDERDQLLKQNEELQSARHTYGQGSSEGYG